LFLFDLSFSDPGPVSRAREAVIELMDRMHPSDRVALAVYTVDRGPELVLNFTDDHDKVRAALTGMGRPHGAEGASDPMNVAVDAPGSTGDVTGLSEAPRDVPPGSADGGDMASEHLRDIMGSVEAGQRRNERMRLHSMSQDLAKVARAMAAVPGRKQVVYLSEGFDQTLVFGAEETLDQLESGQSQEGGLIWEIEGRERAGDAALQRSMDAMLEEFRRADIAIEAIDISPSGRSARSGGRASRSEGLHMLARGTGGELYRAANDLTGAMERMLEETSAYYVLFFQPGDVEPDGTYRKLKIKLKDVPRGAKAVYRTGYFAPRPDDRVRPDKNSPP
jgi:VWFA-related protein